MGIKKINEYTLSEHAQDRLLERFKTTKSNWNAWLNNFNKNAELKRVEKHRGEEAEIWHSGEVGMVVEPATKNIVTIYHIYGKDFPESLKADLRSTALRLQDKSQAKFTTEIKKLADRLAYREFGVVEAEQVIVEMVALKKEYNTYNDGLFALANSEEMGK